MHGFLYQFFQDQGSFIAGILTLIGGGLAYFAGHVQAKATRNAAAAQVDAIREQMDLAHKDALAQIEALERQIDQRNRELADLRTREILDTFSALSKESAYIHRGARDRLEVAEWHFSEVLDVPINASSVEPYRIVAGDILNKISRSDFAGTGINPAADTLHAMVRILASAIDSAGRANRLTARALIGHLQNIIGAAEKLKTHLEQWEANNPMPGYWTAGRERQTLTFK